MKTILTTLNAKYIHTSLALRWIYVANKDSFDIDFIEYSLKEDIDFIVQELLNTQCDVLGFSVCIWNVDQTEIIIKRLKQIKPELILFVGGPEVTYEPEYFLNKWPIDYVISGEGEFVVGELLQAIGNDSPILIDGVSSKQHISKKVIQADIDELIKLDSPYQLDRDKKNMQHRIIYFETSRGCPFQCQYCLSSLEKGVRYFPKEYIEQNLAYLIKEDSRQIKFLDRTFNINKSHTEFVFQYLIQHYRPNLSCQFEVYADILSEELIQNLNSNLPVNFFRFEIGIQSTYEPTNLAVKRMQDFEVLARNIRLLIEGKKVDLHLDLIAGLPHESYERFIQSFNDVFQLKAKEVQLGFLKLLRGTNLRKQADKYGYVYSESAPYEVIENKAITSEELDKIRMAEFALDKLWNSGRFSRTMNLIFSTYYANRYYEFFYSFGKYYKEKGLPIFGYQLEDLYRFLYEFLLSLEIDVLPSLKTDYYQNYNIRPHGFWKSEFTKKERKQLHYQIGQDKEFLQKNRLTRKIVEKQMTIDPLYENSYQLTLFGVRKSNAEEHPVYIYQFKK
mgnify:CR=1 FL=1